METLRRRELETLLEVVRELYVACDLDGFRNRLVALLPRLVACDVVAYFDIDLKKPAIEWLVEPKEAVRFPGASTIYGTYMGQSPLFSAYAQGRGSAVKVSDFLSLAEYRRTALYNEFFRRLGADRQIAKGLPAPRGRVRGATLLRSRRDFDERDRLCLDLLRPHLLQAYRNAEAITRVAGESERLFAAIEKTDRGLVTLAPDGKPRRMTPLAARWLAEYFPGQSGRGGLPDLVVAWLRAQQERLTGSGDAPAAIEPLEIARDGRSLVIRLVLDPTGAILLLEERNGAIAPAALEPLGLTRREAEVLAWVAQGRSNAATAVILDISELTVKKHLEHVYAKLGVWNRTEAAARAAAIART